ncbi:Cellulose biosynthesis protein BcsQ [Desulfacinum infernum DSM 9756]|uniref:Cellulose biosynthesis protein BcsQ n=1 Tax=Desulfacinum infernum DSM 9756 TaxID=1121391 RepID=A0A1M5IGX3_9BACT|nr:ParA family protein [Desulfacinum infernum]SHG27485.1 Cellulose biosynthesis protein BcsQ [Desulfacinum infernum DSM 9756]
MIVTIGNNKGGVGKTSIACNLAAALGRMGKRVLVLDMDSQCNATSILLGGEPVVRGRTMYDLLEPEAGDSFSGSDFVVPTRHLNVYCVPNIEESSALDIPLGRGVPATFTILRDRLPALFPSGSYDFVFLDNPPSIGLWLTISLVASDCVIVPIDAASGHSLAGLRKVLDLIDEVRQALNPSLRFLRLVINRADQRTLVARHIIEQVRMEFPERHFRTIVPLNTAVQQAEYMYRTIFEHDPGSRAAKAYRMLAREFIETVEGVR